MVRKGSAVRVRCWAPRLAPIRPTLAVLAICTLGLCTAAEAAETYGEFADPRPVTLEGFSGSAMEPFITPDGNYLLFNTSNVEPSVPALQFAERTGPQSFRYAGEIEGEGVNQGGSLSGTPTIDDEGTIYFISPRSYGETRSTVYAGSFSAGVVSGIHLVGGLASEGSGQVDFDVDVSPDGSTLYLSSGRFASGSGPSSAGIEIFDKRAGGFNLDPHSESAMRAVNGVGALNYAAAISADELELFFTSANPQVGGAPAIYRATRKSLTKPFGHIARIAAINGYAEAPSLSADGSTLYYHEQLEGHFVVMEVTRARNAPVVSSITPTRGSIGGGTSVTVQGAGFAPGSGTTSFKFASRLAGSVDCPSSTTCTLITPPGRSGTIEVRAQVSRLSRKSPPGDDFTYE